MTDKVKIDVSRAARSAAKVAAAVENKSLAEWASEALLLQAGKQAERKEQAEQK